MDGTPLRGSIGCSPIDPTPAHARPHVAEVLAEVRLSVWPPGLGKRTSNALAQPHGWPWVAFAAWLACPVESDDKHAQAFSPLAEIKPGKGGRVDGGPAHFLVAEYDDAANPDLLERALAYLGSFDAIVYTSARASAACGFRKFWPELFRKFWPVGVRLGSRGFGLERG